MGISSNVTPDGKQVTITIQGRFDFSQHQAFRQAYELAGNHAQYVLDMTGVEYVDSSALGMLLLLKEFVADPDGVKIANCNEKILEILKIANFDKIFTLV